MMSQSSYAMQERLSQMRAQIDMMNTFLAVSTVIATLLVSVTKAQSSPLADLANCAELRKQLIRVQEGSGNI